MTTTQTIDFDAVYAGIVDRLKAEQKRRLEPGWARLWDGDWNFRGSIKQEYSLTCQFLENETGTATVEMPLDYYLSQWLADVKNRKTTNVFLTVDKDGARWSGMLDELFIIKDDQGKRFVRIVFKHDYEHLKHILCFSNPFLPPELQFPRLWVLFGKARWCLKTTLFCNILRLEASLFMLPDNPMDVSKWFNLDQSTWSMVVKPDLTPDNSVSAIVHSRFKNMAEVSKNTVADAQLTWEPRRYLAGDPPPWPGAVLRPGCLVWDLIDNSAWNTGTSFGGDLFSGLVSAFMAIGSDGTTQNVQTVPDPNMPSEYFQPGYMGSNPSVPSVIFREGEHTAIQSSEFSWRPATDVGIVAGGHSMPGINEAIAAAIIMAGNLTSLIPGVPAMGSVADAVLKPLYTDTIMAFAKWKDVGRAQRLGWSHYHEKWAGDGMAYTLAWLLSMRSGLWETRETTRHTITVADGGMWRVGQNGHGHFFLGSRVGSAPLGMQPGIIFVDRVTELVLSWDRDNAPAWKIVIGQREPQDPVIKAWERLQDMLSMMKELGVM